MSLTSLKVGGGGGPGGGGGGGGIGILSLCWHLSVWGEDRWLHCLSWDNTHWLLENDTNTSDSDEEHVQRCSCAFNIQARCKNPVTDEAVKVELWNYTVLWSANTISSSTTKTLQHLKRLKIFWQSQLRNMGSCSFYPTLVLMWSRIYNASFMYSCMGAWAANTSKLLRFVSILYKVCQSIVLRKGFLCTQQFGAAW